MTNDKAAQFGEAVRRRLNDLGQTHEWLGAEMARLLERDRPLHQTTVTNYVNGKVEPEPAGVFAMERALQVAPGTLSQLLGYLPVDRPRGTAVGDAINVDPRLTDSGRRALLAAYQQLIDHGAHSPEAGS
jgi:hypothetical protein